MNEIKKAYAKLVIENGISLQKNGKLVIKTSPSQYEFARLLAITAYEMGASFVNIEMDDLQLLSQRLKLQTVEQLTDLPAFLSSYYQESFEGKWSYIRIDNTEELYLMQGSDSTKTSALTRAVKAISKIKMDSLMTNKSSWCVICVPGPVWAKQVLGKGATEEDLWNLLVPILRLNEPSAGAAWLEEGAVLKQREKKLQDFGVKSLHYKSSVTDFTIGFRKEAIWCGGQNTLPDGRPFFPNIPTAEIFSAPDMMLAEGTICSTRPVNVMNTITENVKFTFKEGKVVKWEAQKGKEILDRFFEMDEGTHRIGECALVDENSPIARSGLVFGSILYDENASCHIALGQSYSDCIKNGDSLDTDEKMHAAGCNTSMMHVDFMVGSRDMDIDALTWDGKNVPIMRQGSFVI